MYLLDAIVCHFLVIDTGRGGLRKNDKVGQRVEEIAKNVILRVTCFLMILWMKFFFSQMHLYR